MSALPVNPAYSKGLLVEHPTFGLGKIVHVSGTRMHVVFRDRAEREAIALDTTRIQLAPATIQTDPILDNIPPLREISGKWVLPRNRITFENAKQVFMNLYPGGFDDPKYLDEDMRKGERGYKAAAHRRFVELFGNGTAESLLASDQISELQRRMYLVIGSLNLLSPFEAMALRDGLIDKAASRRFFVGLFQFLSEAPSSFSFERYCDSIRALPQKQSPVYRWPVVTILPYLANPLTHMFLKPKETKAAAESFGFDIHYDPEPNWTTYAALLQMGKAYFDLLQPLGARDLMDVQSFIFVTCRAN